MRIRGSELPVCLRRIDCCLMSVPYPIEDYALNSAENVMPSFFACASNFSYSNVIGYLLSKTFIVAFIIYVAYIPYKSENQNHLFQQKNQPAPLQTDYQFLSVYDCPGTLVISLLWYHSAPL